MRHALIVLLFAISLPLFGDITVSTVTPSAGLIAGGTIVHIHGTNLLGAPLACAALECSVYVRFGDTLGTVIFDSAGEIVAVAPPHAAGPVDLVVNVPVSTPLTLKNAFVYQDPADTNVRLLLPIAAGTQGILNTSWQTDVLAHNETTSPVVIAGKTVPPLATQKLALSPTSTGMFLQIPRTVFEALTITTHVHDKTHDAENLGVDVPSVPETQFRRAVVLNGIPNDARYRLLLRVYGYPGTYAITVRVRDDSPYSSYSVNPSFNELLFSQDLTLAGSDVAYLQMPIAAPSTSAVLRVEVTTSQPSDPPIWAFITLTNNTTEAVTTITPNAVVTASAPPPAPVLPVGVWGCLKVTSDVVTVSLGCEGAQFPVPHIEPDGHFEVDGTYQGFGGAFPKVGAFAFGPDPAHISGLVKDGAVTFTIQSPGYTSGPYTFRFVAATCQLIACS